MGLIDSVINYHTETQEAKRQRAWNEAMWNKQNQYNLPANQMQRYRDAGLNPNLIYGQGTPGNAEKVQPYTRPTGKASFSLNPLNELAQYADIKVKTATAKNIDADTKFKGQQTATEEWDTLTAEIKQVLTQAQYDDFSNQFRVKWMGQKLEDTPGGKAVLAGSQKAVNDAEISKQRSYIEKQMVNWFKANQASKWIPLLTAALRFM